jgi:hypothetical protein
MAQSIVALLCIGSLLAWDDSVVIHCEHPASPSAQPAPPIVVPRIQTLGIEAVTPDLAEEGAESAHQHKAAPAKGGAREHQHQPASAKARPRQHQHQPSSIDRGEQQHQH